MPFEGCSALKDEVSLVTYEISCCLFFNKHKWFRKARISRYGIIVDQVLGKAVRKVIPFIFMAVLAAKKVKDSTASTGSPLAVGQLGHSMSMHYCQLKSTL
ncbi:hypothetical protein RIF29_45470 [Crotalaria pallida]|uniref:Uncharacterized protein n=1 Tax=Crotalaria pallida TaxID=3830 RepID=A0AAN9HGK5_CROPI